VHARRLVAICTVVAVIAVLAFFVRFVAYPHTDPIGKTGLVVLVNSPGDSNKIAVAKKVLAVNPTATLLFSEAAGCPDVVHTFAEHVVCFVPHPDTTQGEARYAASYDESHDSGGMTVVAPRAQLSRARIRFERCWHGPLAMVEAPMSLVATLLRLPYQSLATIKAETVQRGC